MEVLLKHLILLLLGSSNAFAASGAPPGDQTDHYATTKVISLQNGKISEQIGLQPGDIIETINGEDVADPKQALARLEKPGPYLIHIKRSGRDEVLQYEVAE